MLREVKKTCLVGVSLLFVLVTTVCYSLPVMLVSLNLGHIVGNITLYFPWLVYLTKRKFSIFIGSGLLLILTDRLYKKIRDNDSANPNSTRNSLIIWNHRIFNVALLLWLISFILAYLLTPALLFMDML